MFFFEIFVYVNFDKDCCVDEIYLFNKKCCHIVMYLVILAL